MRLSGDFFNPPAGIPNSPQCPGKLQNRSLKAGQGREPSQNLPSFVTPMNSSTNSNSIQLPHCPNAPQTYTSSICCTQMYVRVCLFMRLLQCFVVVKGQPKGQHHFGGLRQKKEEYSHFVVLVKEKQPNNTHNFGGLRKKKRGPTR